MQKVNPCAQKTTKVHIDTRLNLGLRYWL